MAQSTYRLDWSSCFLKVDLVALARALSPKTGEKTITDQSNVGSPFRMLREDSLLGVDAVNQRRPTDQYEEERGGIPFLQVVADVGNDI